MTERHVQVESADADALVDAAISRAEGWMRRADQLRTRKDRARRRRITRLLDDPDGLAVTRLLTDEVMRVGDPERAAGILRRAAELSNRHGLGARDHLGLKGLDVLSHMAPRAAVDLVHWQVRAAAKGVILPAEEAELAAHARRRAAHGAQLNINVLGEAVLGDQEAASRLDRVLEMIARPGTTHVSVKISAISANLSPYDTDGTVQRVAVALRRLFAAATAKHPQTFVNLDMEEFRDLELTLAAFRLVLDEPEHRGTSAGLVLQSYLPDSHEAMLQLLAWAHARHESGGAAIKVRIVKGANLAMERTEAELHGWPAAPLRSKLLVDASWKRLVESALRPENKSVMRVGIASHNLFDLAWALELGSSRSVLDQVDVEMLEGMANAEARAIADDVGSVLLYAPVTRADDFPSAVAYLVRRLDENTAPENYLRSSFHMSVESPEFGRQTDRFRAAVAARRTLDTTSLRHGGPPEDPSEAEELPGFRNTAQLDVTRPDEREAIGAALAEVARSKPEISPVIGGRSVFRATIRQGIDPNDGGAPWYECRIPTVGDVEDAVAAASRAVAQWESQGPRKRRRILMAAAQRMFGERHRTLAVMARDAGKTIAEGIPEIAEAIDFARFYARSAVELEGRGPSEPLGVVAVVPPWNFPYAIPAGGALAALAAGNSVILKPAPETRATAWLLAQQLWAAGVPREVLSFLPCDDDDAGKCLITHPDMAAVILTGSWQTAEMFLRWRPDLTLLAETSGKNALLVSATADVEAAVRDVVASAFGHAGQKCSAASLAIVEASVHDSPAFQRQLVDAVTSLRVGSALHPGTIMGPVIRPPGETLHRALTELDSDESWLVAPRQLDPAGHVWAPGVRLGVEPGSWTHRTEWFGPTLGVMRAPDLTTALAWQNDVEFGLTAGLHALDPDECAWWIDAVAAGNLYVNRGTTGAVVNRQPFGGWKKSSVGPTAKAGGENYVACLRRWPGGRIDPEALSQWWREVGGTARDPAGLEAERNVIRFRHFDRPILVRVDASIDPIDLESVRRIAAVTGARIRLSGPPGLAADVKADSQDDVVASLTRGELGRIRWLTREDPGPILAAALTAGVSVDRRLLAADVHIEGPRWLREQVVCVTAHRYGNVGAGPQPPVRGLG